MKNCELELVISTTFSITLYSRRSPLDLVLPPPAPCVSNLPEKLIICHIASALRHTPNRSGTVSKVLVKSLNRALDAFGFGHRIWRTDALTEPSWCASVLLVWSSGTLHRQLPIHLDSGQWDNAATLFLLGPCKVTQWLSVQTYFIIFLPFLSVSFFGSDMKVPCSGSASKLAESI